MPQSLLEQLRKVTTVVADTGDIEAMEQFKPTDATTNPSLITAAAQMPQYQPIVDNVLIRGPQRAGRKRHRPGRSKSGVQAAGRGLLGKKILAIVPGRVSTEVDARLSFDTHQRPSTWPARSSRSTTQRESAATTC